MNSKLRVFASFRTYYHWHSSLLNESMPIVCAYNDSARTSPNSGGIGTSALGALNKTAYHILSNTTGTVCPAVHDRLTSLPKMPSAPEPSHRWLTSIPHLLPSSLKHRLISTMTPRARGLSSPPIVEFMRFEDMIRGLRTGNYEGLLATPKAKAGNKYGGMRSNRHGC